MSGSAAAFPRPVGNNGAAHFEDRYANEEQAGMTLREYFAAHAPKTPQAWFSPVMATPRPEETWDHEHDKCDYCERLPVNWKERNAWSAEREKQRLIQWPWAWADAVLAAGGVE
jgi:hypothetical protein